MGVCTCAPFTKGSGAPEHRRTTRNIVRSKVFQVRAHLNLFFLERFRFGIQVQVQVKVQVQELQNPSESDSGNNTESNTIGTQYDSNQSLSPSTFTQLKRPDFREQVQKGSNKRCKKVSGAPKRCKQVRGVFEKVQTGARRFRFRCKKVFQVQVHRRTGRVREQLWLQSH